MPPSEPGYRLNIVCWGGPGVVEAWAAGGTWAQVTADSNLDDGDIMRLLNRTSDLLRQARVSHQACSPLTCGQALSNTSSVVCH